MRFTLAIVLAVLSVVAGITALNSARVVAGLGPMAETPADRFDMLAPYLEADGNGTRTLVLASGCDGVRDNMALWAEDFMETGGSTLVVDSHTPRDLNRIDLWRLVCAGQVMPGITRAGDLIATMPAGRVTLLGASHGGWAVMETLAALLVEDPPGLTRFPEPPQETLDRISGAVVLYPYCGAIIEADRGDWSRAPPLLMILGREDSVISTPDCLDLAGRLRDRGATITVRVLEGVDHGFDQAVRSPLSDLDFDPEATAAAREMIEAFWADPRAGSP